MQTAVFSVMLLIIISFLLKQSFLPWKYVLSVTVLAALWVAFSWSWAVEQSKTQIADWLASPSMMADTAVLLTVEVALQLTFCLAEANFVSWNVLTARKKIIFGFLRYFPGLLFFAVLFTILVTLIFSLPGTSFTLISWMFGGVVLLLIPALILLLKWAVPKNYIRLELLFMLNVLMAAVGVIATVNGRTAVEGTDYVNCTSLAGLLAVTLVVATAGFYLRKAILKNKNKHKHITN